MNFADLQDKELAVLYKLTGKWSRKYPAFGAVIRAALTTEEHRRQGYDKRQAAAQLPALPREEMCNLVFSLLWTAKDVNTGHVDRVGTVVLDLARDMIDLTLKREAELFATGLVAGFSDSLRTRDGA
ncbi:MAG: hypothetical protein HY067_09615 [Betaproteobacteria bacterium]|nr:hypothetical protein [Betaproteobacteria bacterium]